MIVSLWMLLIECVDWFDIWCGKRYCRLVPDPLLIRQAHDSLRSSLEKSVDAGIIGEAIAAIGDKQCA